MWLWKYTVIDEKLPLVNHIEKNGFSTHAITKAEKFTTTVTIKNMESTTLKGRIRVDYERNIKKFAVGDTYPEDDPAGDFWDESHLVVVYYLFYMLLDSVG